MSIKSPLMYSYIEAPSISKCKDEAGRRGLRGAGDEVLRRSAGSRISGMQERVPALDELLPLQAAQEKNELNSYFATKEYTQCPEKKIHQ